MNLGIFDCLEADKREGGGKKTWIVASSLQKIQTTYF